MGKSNGHGITFPFGRLPCCESAHGLLVSRNLLKWQLSYLTSDREQFPLQVGTGAVKYFLRFACEGESEMREFTGNNKPPVFKTKLRFLAEDRSLLGLLVSVLRSSNIFSL